MRIAQYETSFLDGTQINVIQWKKQKWIKNTAQNTQISRVYFSQSSFWIPFYRLFFFPWGKNCFLYFNCHFSVRKAILISSLKEFSNVLPAAHKVAFVLCLNWEFPSEVIKWNKLKNKHLYLPQRRINRLQICFRGKAGKWTRLTTIMDHLAP